jgi:hypothetical protein
MPLLFSYGTLQDESVQLATFGRRLVGQPDELPGFRRSSVPIADPQVVAETGMTHYANAVLTGSREDRIAGTAFEVTDADLARADAYEADAAYERVAARLLSGREAWVYAYALDDGYHVNGGSASEP